MNSISQKNSNINEIWQEIQKANSVLILLGRRVDYDAVCSGLIIQSVLSRLGKVVKLFTEKELPIEFKQNLITASKNISLFDNLIVEKNSLEFGFNEYDLIITVDIGDESMIVSSEALEKVLSQKVVNFDHHSGNTRYANFNYVLPRGSAASTIYEFFQEVKVELNEFEVRMVLLAIAIDTDYFKLDSVSIEDFKIVHEILTKHNLTFYNSIQPVLKYLPEDHAKFRTLLYKHIQFKYGGKFVSAYISADELIEAGLGTDFVTAYPPADELKEFINVKVALFVREKYTPDGTQVRHTLSWRTYDDDIDFLEFFKSLPEQFNGGGHKKAVGMNVTGFNSCQEVIEFLEKRVVEYWGLN